MKLTKETTTTAGVARMFEGENGVAVLTRNCGNNDKHDRWALAVSIHGEYQRVASRMEYQKAYAIAEAMIG